MLSSLSSFMLIPRLVKSRVLIQIASLVFRSVTEFAVSRMEIFMLFTVWSGWLKCFEIPVFFFSLIELLWPVNLIFSLPFVSPTYIFSHLEHLMMYIKFVWLQCGGSSL